MKPKFSAQGIGRLKKVMVHMPGVEFNNLDPLNLKENLFDALPDLQHAQIEHKKFVTTLQKLGVKVLMLKQVLSKSKEAKTLCEIITRLPNIFFMRDQAIITDDGAIICSMRYVAREPEPIIVKIALKNLGIQTFDITPPATLEGCDVLFLNEKTMLVGYGERTNLEGIEQVKEFWWNPQNNERTLVTLRIRAERTSMHLDTVLGIISRHIITAYLPAIEDVILFSPEEQKGKKISFEEFLQRMNLLCISLTLREQYNMAANTLMVNSNNILAYSRSFDANRINKLKKKGITVYGAYDRRNLNQMLYLPQLFIAGGGPHCMVLELQRDKN